MKTPAPRPFLTLWCLAAVAVPFSAQGQMPSQPFQVGTAFPTVPLPSLEDGRPASIADFRGERVILHVFASW